MTTKIPAPRPVRQGELAPAIVLREILRHYLEFRDYVQSGAGHVLEHSYLVPEDTGEFRKITISFSFWDLHKGIKTLAPRKREALFHNVILDKKQEDVAKIMGITTVSVGQYVRAAMEQLIQYHFDMGDTDG